jgi:hypothetical protein
MGTFMKKKSDLYVGQRHEVEERESDHEADHGVFVDDVDFIDEGFGMGVKAEDLEGEFMFRVVVFSEVRPIRGKQMVDRNGYQGDGFEHLLIRQYGLIISSNYKFK